MKMKSNQINQPINQSITQSLKTLMVISKTIISRYKRIIQVQDIKILTAMTEDLDLCEKDNDQPQTVLINIKKKNFPHGTQEKKITTQKKENFNILGEPEKFPLLKIHSTKSTS